MACPYSRDHKILKNFDLAHLTGDSREWQQPSHNGRPRAKSDFCAERLLWRNQGNEGLLWFTATQWPEMVGCGLGGP